MYGMSCCRYWMMDGLTDNKGRVVNFKNTIIIMTSNIGSHLIQEAFEGVTEKNIEQAADKAKVRSDESSEANHPA